MKLKRADRPDWRRIARRRFVSTTIADEHFHGYASLICLDEVFEPLWVLCAGHHICIVDHGYCWLQLFPLDEHYALTAAFDAQGELSQFYIDICNKHYSDADGIIWYEDLYLDIVLTQDSETELLDADELDEALQTKLITQQDYDLAWNEAKAVQQAIAEQRFPLLNLAQHYKTMLLAQLPAQHPEPTDASPAD